MKDRDGEFQREVELNLRGAIDPPPPPFIVLCLGCLQNPEEQIGDDTRAKYGTTTSNQRGLLEEAKQGSWKRSQR
jgi:hypothetical protein